MVKLALSYVAGGIANWSSPLGKQFGILIKNHKTPILPDPVILLLGIHSRKIFSNMIFTPLFKAAKKKRKKKEVEGNS